MPIEGGYDFVNKDSNPMDDEGHGTWCAGIVAAVNNDIGVIGANPDASLFGVKVLDSSGSSYVSDLVAGIEWSVNNGMNIISMSLGAIRGSKSLKNACNNAYNKGLLLVAAAGNSGNSKGVGNTVEYPARYGSVIAVSATNKNDERPSWSSTGPDVELAAPGVDIYSTSWNDIYATGSGTSASCPHVSGTAALVWANYSDYTNKEVRDKLNNTAEDIGPNGKDKWFGYGLVDAEAAARLISEPSVSWVNPKDGDTVSGSVAIQIDASDAQDPEGSLTVEWNVDGESWKSATYVSGTGYYENTWDTTGVSDGSHTLEARATDSDGNVSKTSITVNVSKEGGGNKMYVWDISWRETGPHLRATVTILVDSDGDGNAESTDDPVSDASVDFTLTNQRTSDSQSYGGTTDSEGKVKFTWKHASSGIYEGKVTELTHSTYTWNSSLDNDNPDTYKVK